MPHSLLPHPLSPQVGEGWRSRGEGNPHAGGEGNCSTDFLSPRGPSPTVQSLGRGGAFCASGARMETRRERATRNEEHPLGLLARRNALALALPFLALQGPQRLASKKPLYQQRRSTWRSAADNGSPPPARLPNLHPHSCRGGAHACAVLSPVGRRAPR